MSERQYHSVVYYDEADDKWVVEPYSDFIGGDGDIYDYDQEEWRNCITEEEEYYDKTSWEKLKEAVASIKPIPRFGAPLDNSEPDVIYQNQQRKATMLLRQALGEVLRETRNEKGRTLRWVASRANTSISYISEIELGKKEVSSEILEQLANTLGVPVAHLVMEMGYKMSGVPDTPQELFEADQYADLIPRYELVTN